MTCGLSYPPPLAQRRRVSFRGTYRTEAEAHVLPSKVPADAIHATSFTDVEWISGVSD